MLARAKLSDKKSLQPLALPRTSSRRHKETIFLFESIYRAKPSADYRFFNDLRVIHLDTSVHLLP